MKELHFVYTCTCIGENNNMLFVGYDNSLKVKTCFNVLRNGCALPTGLTDKTNLIKIILITFHKGT